MNCDLMIKTLLAFVKKDLTIRDGSLDINTIIILCGGDDDGLRMQFLGCSCREVCALTACRCEIITNISRRRQRLLLSPTHLALLLFNARNLPTHSFCYCHSPFINKYRSSSFLTSAPPQPQPPSSSSPLLSLRSNPPPSLSYQSPFSHLLRVSLSSPLQICIEGG